MFTVTRNFATTPEPLTLIGMVAPTGLLSGIGTGPPEEPKVAGDPRTSVPVGMENLIVVCPPLKVSASENWSAWPQTCVDATIKRKSGVPVAVVFGAMVPYDTTAFVSVIALVDESVPATPVAFASPPFVIPTVSETVSPGETCG